MAVSQDVVLSVILVSYKSRPFILFCLESIITSLEGIDSEMIVVDNHSEDGTTAAISRFFPTIKIIENNTNLGFGAAANMGIKLARGTFITVINPDTVVAEQLFATCIKTYKETNDAGLLSCKLMDGRGKYLKESARRVPTIKNSLLKLLFNQSVNSDYYQKLDERYIQSVEVLPGAFIFCSKRIIDELGGFDERYFMYGEDIDISKKSLSLGKINILINDDLIIHTKGESSNIKSWKNRQAFYEAMFLYVNKWNKLGVFSKLLFKFGSTLLFYMRMMANLLAKLKWPIIDFTVAGSVFLWIVELWSRIYYKDPQYYQTVPVFMLASLFGLSYVIVLFFKASYIRQDHNSKKWLAKWPWLFLVLFAIYGLLPDYLRLGRMILFLSIPISLMIAYLMRSLFSANKVSPSLITKAINRDIIYAKAWSLFDHVYYEDELIIPSDLQKHSAMYIDVDAYRISSIISFLKSHGQAHRIGLLNIKRSHSWLFSGPHQPSSFTDKYADYLYFQNQARFERRIVDMIVAICLFPISVVTVLFDNRLIMNNYNLIMGISSLIGPSAERLTAYDVYEPVSPICVIDDWLRVPLSDYLKTYMIWYDIKLLFKHLSRVWRSLHRDV